MKKRLLAALVCVVLVLSLLPVTARAGSADETLYYSKGDNKLHIGSKTGLEYTGGGYQGQDACLTLENFHLISSAPIALSLPDATTLVLKGTNTVTSTYSGEKDCIGIFSNSDIYIQGSSTSGDNTLTVTIDGAKGSKYNCGVKAGRIHLSNYCRVTARAGINNSNASSNYGVWTETEGIIVTDNASLTGKAGAPNSTSANSVSYGVVAKTSIEVSGNGSITGVSGKASDSYGVYSRDGVTVAGTGSLIGISEGLSSSAMNPHSYGIAVGYSQQINVFSGVTVLAKGYTSALSKAANLGNGVSAKASTNYNGSNVEDYAPDKIAEYKYFRTLDTIPALQLSVSPQSSFVHGQAPDNETVTIGSTYQGFNASNYFDSATMDGGSIDVGSVGIPGAHGSVSNGSIVIRLNKAYLDTLPVGTHTLRVYLTGVYAGETVETQITVLPSGGGIGAGGDVGPDVPQTGDAATPVLWLMIALLAGAGLAVRRKRAL